MKEKMERILGALAVIYALISMLFLFSLSTIANLSSVIVLTSSAVTSIILLIGIYLIFVKRKVEHYNLEKTKG